MRCHDCDHGFECCHEPSVRHADGTTECLGPEPCVLVHDLHVWALECDEETCACQALDLEVPPEELPLAA